MSLGKKEQLYGWGHTPVAECISFRPEKRRDLQALLGEHEGALLARGLGRSYGDASLQPEGTILTPRLDHFIDFDATTGIARAQTGVSLAAIMELCVPKGWLPPVIPGTRHVTLGGALASNVHGKNHFKTGEFAEHVLSIRLMLASGETVECSPTEHTDLFWATAGGMGMTGIIEEVTFQLRPITSSSLKTLTYRVDKIADMIAAFEHYRHDCDYMVGWIDHTAKGGENIGRGVFEAAYDISSADGGAPLSPYALPKTKITIPFFAPPWLLNRYVMSVYNARRFKRYSVERVSEIVGFNGFFHPLDSIGQWNRLYGKRGFFQYECLLPEVPGVADHLQALLEGIHKNGLFSFLAVLKYHRAGKGFLTFSKAGYSLALDFPNTARVRNFLPHLNEWVVERGGRVYLAKDTSLTPEIFDAMYPEAAHWRDLLRDIDPHNRFSSLMSKRLQWKER